MIKKSRQSVLSFQIQAGMGIPGKEIEKGPRTEDIRSDQDTLSMRKGPGKVFMGNHTTTARQLPWTGTLFTAFILCFAMLLSGKVHASETGTGWSTISAGGQIAYINPDGTYAKGFTKIGKKYYCFNQEGALVTGWIAAEDGSRYYASPAGNVGTTFGALKAGYKKVDGLYYYFDKTAGPGNYGKMATGFVNVSGTIFYFNEDGSKQTGLSTIGSDLYCFQSDGTAKKVGAMLTGWQTIEGKRYYFQTDGGLGIIGKAYKSVTQSIGGVQYVFDENGVCTGTQTAQTSQVSQVSQVSPSSSSARTTEDTNAAFIETIGSMAHDDMMKTGVLASITTAQAIVESAFGKSELAVNAHNLFGMKGSLSASSWESVWDGTIYEKNTKEFVNGAYITVKAPFRQYNTWSESIADHSAYLTGAKISSTAFRYAGISTCRDYETAAKIIKNGGYATAPTYVSALCQVVEQYDLTRFD